MFCTRIVISNFFTGMILGGRGGALKVARFIFSFAVVKVGYLGSPTTTTPLCVEMLA